jgi:UDP-N-acetylglucosamine 2-epimerase
MQNSVRLVLMGLKSPMEGVLKSTLLVAWNIPKTTVKPVHKDFTKIIINAILILSPTAQLMKLLWTLVIHVYLVSKKILMTASSSMKITAKPLTLQALALNATMVTSKPLLAATLRTLPFA